MAVNLDRSPKYTDHNIPLEEDNFYRGVSVGENGWESLFDEDGIMKGGGKGGTENLSFQKGAPNELYINSLVKADTILESDSTLNPDRVEEKSGYTYKNEISRKDIESGELHLRVWQRKMGDVALKLTNVWNPVFDSFPNEENTPEE